MSLQNIYAKEMSKFARHSSPQPTTSEADNVAEVIISSSEACTA
jgi:hypothetical protein